MGGNVFDHPLITEGVRRAEVIHIIVHAAFLASPPFLLALWLCRHPLKEKFAREINRAIDEHEQQQYYEGVTVVEREK